MAKFCTGCGAPLEIDARFCNGCGKPVSTAVTAPRAAPAPAGRRPSPKLLIAIGAGVALLVVIGAAVALLMNMMDSGPRDSEVKSAIDAMMKRSGAEVRSATCLTNMRYPSERVNVRRDNAETLEWMALLVKLGLFTEAERGTGAAQVLRTYVATDTGKKAIRQGYLCVADGVEVKRIVKKVPVKGAREVVEVEVELGFQNAASWASDATIVKNLGDRTRSGKWTATLPFAKDKGKWVYAVALESPPAAPGTTPPTAAPADKGSKPAESPGFFASLRNLLPSFGGNPLIGRWKMDLGAVGAGDMGIELEFRSSERLSAGAAVKVRYEVRSDEVLVYPEAAGKTGVALRLKLIDRDTIEQDAGLIAVRYKRVN
jgi:hypothetical protein